MKNIEYYLTHNELTLCIYLTIFSFPTPAEMVRVILDNKTMTDDDAMKALRVVTLSKVFPYLDRGVKTLHEAKYRFQGLDDNMEPIHGPLLTADSLAKIRATTIDGMLRSEPRIADALDFIRWTCPLPRLLEVAEDTLMSMAETLNHDKNMRTVFSVLKSCAEGGGTLEEIQERVDEAVKKMGAHGLEVQVAAVPINLDKDKAH